jgi:hypothetical protein
LPGALLDNRGQKIDRSLKPAVVVSAAKVEGGSRCDVGRLDIVPIEAPAGLHGLVKRANQQAASEQSDILTAHPEPVLWARHCPRRVRRLRQMRRRKTGSEASARTGFQRTVIDVVGRSFVLPSRTSASLSYSIAKPT